MPAVSLLSLVYYDSKSIMKNMLLLHCSVIYIIFVELMFYSGGAWGQTDADILAWKFLVMTHPWVLMSPEDMHYLHNYICILSLFSKQ